MHVTCLFVNFLQNGDWYEPMKNYAAWKGLETYTNSSILPNLFFKVRPLINERKKHWKNLLDSKIAGIKETQDFKKFEKLKNALEKIKSYTIVEVPDYPRDASNQSGNFDLHCEIKLFKHLKRKKVVDTSKLSWDEAKAFIVIIGYLKLPRGELKPDTIRYPDMFIQ